MARRRRHGMGSPLRSTDHCRRRRDYVRIGPTTIGRCCMGKIAEALNPMGSVPAYQEFVDFIAAGTTPQKVLDFQPSEKAKGRVSELVQRQKMSSLTEAETE